MEQRRTHSSVELDRDPSHRVDSGAVIRGCSVPVGRDTIQHKPIAQQRVELVPAATLHRGGVYVHGGVSILIRPGRVRHGKGPVNARLMSRLQNNEVSPELPLDLKPSDIGGNPL